MGRGVEDLVKRITGGNSENAIACWPGEFAAAIVSRGGFLGNVKKVGLVFTDGEGLEDPAGTRIRSGQDGGNRSENSLIGTQSWDDRTAYRK